MKKGSVLLLSLWATATLATVGIVQATRLSLEVRWVDRLQEQRQAWYLAWTGVESARSLLTSDSSPSDSLKETWAQSPKDPISLGPGPAPAGSSQVGPGTFRYQVSDEQSRIPLNFMNGFSSGNALLLQLKFSPAAATQLLARLNENPKRPLVHLAELLTLQGVTPELLSHLETLVTLVGEWPVNINTASPDVLELLGLSMSGANQIAGYRSGSDGILGNGDDHSFDEEGKIMSDLESAQVILTNEDKVILSNLIMGGFIGVRSRFFKVDTEGRTQRHGIRQRLSVLLERKTLGTAPLIRGWYET